MSLDAVAVARAVGAALAPFGLAGPPAIEVAPRLLSDARPTVLIGLPYSGETQLARKARALGAPVLISTGSIFRKGRGFQPIGGAAWTSYGAALDSAGFTAMLQGGYRWTVAEYVDFVVTNSGAGEMPFPWAWWSAMDYCVEPEIAGNMAEVERRIDLTIRSYGETLDMLIGWREEGINDVPDPLPILQGRLPEHYIRCAKALADEIDEHHDCTCPFGQDDCTAGWHRRYLGLPELVGVGSVCRRAVQGPDGILAVLDALNEALPAHTRLHLFGVKAQALAEIPDRLLWRVKSVDSMAYDFAARMDVQKERRRTGEPIAFSMDRRAESMGRWYAAQQARLSARTSSHK